MRSRVASCAFAAAVAAGAAPALAQLRIVTMNASNAQDLGDQSTPRTPWMTTILTAIGTEVSDDPNLAGNTGIAKPIDVLLLQEITSPLSTSAGYANLLNSIYGGTSYTYSTTAGNSTGAGTQGLVYNKNALTLVGTVAVGTASTSGQPRQAVRYQLRPIGYSSAADIYIYNSHYKSGDSTTDEGRRLPEAQAIRTNADALPAGCNIIYTGDFNVYRNTDPFYQHLMSAGNGQAVDPINKQGSWTANPSFKTVHTQSPFNSATASSLNTGFSGTTGGMDDRFDQQLVTAAVNDGHGFAYIANSYHAFGNNGTHTFVSASDPNNMNQPINNPNNTAQPMNVLDAMAATMDHIPVVVDYMLPAKLAATTATAPATIIKNTSVGVGVNVWNAAPVTFANGADQLSYTLATSGAVSGALSGTDSALGATNNHTVSLSTATVGAKSGSYSVTSTSQQDGGTTLSQSVNYTVVDHANASFNAVSDADSQTIDFGYVPQNFTNRTAPFGISNLDASGFTANLDLDAVNGSGDTARLTANVAPTGGTPIAPNVTVNYTAAALTDIVGNFSATRTITNSDENIPGAASGASLTLTTTSRIIATGDFPVTGFINLFSGETFSASTATIGPGVTLTKSGAGTLLFSGPQSHGANSNLLITGGSVIMSDDAGSAAAAPLSVSVGSGTSAIFNETQHLRGLSIAASASAAMPTAGNRTLYTDTLSIDPAGGLDLADNDLVVNTGSYTAIKAMVAAGLANNTQIYSSTDDGTQILALFDNSFANKTEWNGTTIAAGAIVGKYTYYGDVNFDGQVTGDDYTIIDSNLNTTPPVGYEWLSGDANGDGTVTGDDYTIIDSKLGLGVGNPLSPASLSAVPEPSSVMVAVIGAWGLMWRRQRRVKSR